jgi:hypothetical protein
VYFLHVFCMCRLLVFNNKVKSQLSYAEELSMFLINKMLRDVKIHIFGW